MANLHELATSIGNTWMICGLGALAAGLAAIALMSGAAKIKGSILPKRFPTDPEARLDKYVLSFTQLDQKALDAADLAKQLKDHPATHLCLTAFAVAGGDVEKVLKSTAGNNSGATTDDDGDFPATVDLSIPKSVDLPVNAKTDKKGRGKK